MCDGMRGAAAFPLKGSTDVGRPVVIGLPGVAAAEANADVDKVNITLAEGYEGYTEPATATLSLLALAALAARRRRRA